MARLYDVHAALPASKPELTTLARGLTTQERPGDYAQAWMDLGATICPPRKPACGICPWHDACAARVAGTAAELPKKTPKKKTPTRLGIAYVARRADGAWLLETRPETGLLGGMLGWPGSDWSDAPEAAPPMDVAWETLNTEARHTFTHFHLRLKIMISRVTLDDKPTRGHFVSQAEFNPTALPTAMRKVFDLAHVTLRDH
jgi:A/G-specific adenine glycosylase